MRKVFIFALSLILGLSSICYAFADDVSGEVPASSPDFSPEVIEFISQASDDDDFQLRQAAAIMAATSTYDIDDIYSILSSVRMIDNSRYVWATYDESVWSEVHNVYNKLITNSYNSTYYSVSELVAQLLIQFNSFSSFFYSPISGSASLWQLSDDIKTFVGLGLFDSQANPYLDLINSKISTLSSSMISGFNAVLSRQGHLLSSVDSLRSDVQGTTSAVNNTTNSVNNVVSSVDGFKSDFNNINWISPSSSVVYSNYLDFHNTITSGSYLNIYADITFNTDIFNSPIYRFTLPLNSSNWFYGLSNLELEFYRGQQVYHPVYKVHVDYSDRSVVIFVRDIYTHWSANTNHLVIHFYCPNYIELNTLSSASVDYILNNSSDYYIIDQYLTDNSAFNILQKFEQLYASDDLIQSKMNQQSYEDQAISDFTGSGSAAAKGSDLTDLKSVSGTIQSGLQSGGSVSNALAPFNPSGGFWGWFSQSNSDDINNPSLRRRDDQFIDFYSDNQDLLHSLLQGDSR